MSKNTGVKRTAKPSPNLVLKSKVRSQNNKKKKIKGIKCVCRKSWCPQCGKKTTVSRFINRIKDWKWEYVRQVILTVDSQLYDDQEKCIKTINAKKHIANAIRNLERTKGVKIIDWQWTLEWHGNGYPHWHLFLLMEKKGKTGMIGGDNIRQYWKSGRIIESYIRNSDHWDKITGYFETHGYFSKKKAYQSILPLWAKEKKYVIRRTGGKPNLQGKNKYKHKERYLEKEELRINRQEELNEILTGIELGKWFEKQGEILAGKTEGEKLDACGCETDIYLELGFKNYLGRIDIPYKEFRLLNGNFQEGQGYVVEVDTNTLNDLIMKIQGNQGANLNDFIMAIN